MVEDSPKGTARVRQYLTNTYAELRKVVWPTRDEAVNLTLAVLFVTLVMTVILALVDWLFSQLLNGLLTLVSG